MMKDRFNLEVTKADYDKLARAMYEGQPHPGPIQSLSRRLIERRGKL